MLSLFESVNVADQDAASQQIYSVQVCW